jgi:hypothetical protein
MTCTLACRLRGKIKEEVVEVQLPAACCFPYDEGARLTVAKLGMSVTPHICYINRFLSVQNRR